MNRFPDELMLRALRLEELPDRKIQLWQLETDFRFISPRVGEIVIPRGYVSDLASVPPAAKTFIDDDDPRILPPSIGYNWGYTHGGRLPDGRVYTKEMADLDLHDGMLERGAPKWLAYAVLLAVRVFGKPRFKSQ